MMDYSEGIPLENPTPEEVERMREADRSILRDIYKEGLTKLHARENEIQMYRDAVELWGIDAQVLMLLEEMAELQDVVCKYGRSRSTVQEIASEMADVLIMLKQMQVIFGIDEFMLDGWKAKKLECLKEVIDEWKER